MDYVDIATRAARELNVLLPDGRLHIDSMQMHDLVARLEELAGVKIPSTALRRKAFHSTATLAELVAQHVK